MAFLKEDPSGGEKGRAGGAKVPAGGVGHRVEGVGWPAGCGRGLTVCEVDRGAAGHSFVGGMGIRKPAELGSRAGEQAQRDCARGTEEGTSARR